MMKYLIDTQIFIWWDSNFERLSKKLLQLCEDVDNTLVLSVASIWEMQIKSQIGKLYLGRSLEQIIDEQIHNNQIELLPIKASHVFGLQKLPFYHKDPFDRIIIAQAQAENLPILSVDAIFSQYQITVIN